MKRLFFVCIALVIMLHVALGPRLLARNACAVQAAMPRFPGPGIPKILHLQWPDKPMGPVQNATFQAYRRLFPEWKIELWNDARLAEFMDREFSFFTHEIWWSFPKLIQRLDVARYFLLYKYGGLYSDLDYEPRANFAEFLSSTQVSLPESPLQGAEWVQNSLMASPPRHDFWLHVFAKVENHRGGGSVAEDTGCGMLSRVARTHAEMVHVLPCEVFMRQSPLSFLQGDVVSALVQKLVFPSLGWAKRCGTYEQPCMLAAHYGTSLRPV